MQWLKGFVPKGKLALTPHPPLTSFLCSGSFVIEFRDDSQMSSADEQGSVTADLQPRRASHYPNGQVLPDLALSASSKSDTVSIGTASSCFSRAMLRDRDDLSSANETQTTEEDKEEGRG